jgi:hypothetical protein
MSMTATTCAAPPVTEAGPDWWTVVAAMSESGASPHTIAAALNQGVRPGDARRWHWRQVAAMVVPAPERRPRRGTPTTSTTRDHAVVLRVLHDERDRDIDLATRIGLHLQRGDSSATIAALLNRLGLRTVRDSRWTAGAVDAFIHSGVRGADAGTVPANPRSWT